MLQIGIFKGIRIDNDCLSNLQTEAPKANQPKPVSICGYRLVGVWRLNHLSTAGAEVHLKEKGKLYFLGWWWWGWAV